MSDHVDVVFVVECDAVAELDSRLAKLRLDDAILLGLEITSPGEVCTLSTLKSRILAFVIIFIGKIKGFTSLAKAFVKLSPSKNFAAYCKLRNCNARSSISTFDFNLWHVIGKRVISTEPDRIRAHYAKARPTH